MSKPLDDPVDKIQFCSFFQELKQWTDQEFMKYRDLKLSHDSYMEKKKRGAPGDFIFQEDFWPNGIEYILIDMNQPTTTGFPLSSVPANYDSSNLFDGSPWPDMIEVTKRMGNDQLPRALITTPGRRPKSGYVNPSTNPVNRFSINEKSVKAFLGTFKEVYTVISKKPKTVYPFSSDATPTGTVGKTKFNKKNEILEEFPTKAAYLAIFLYIREAIEREDYKINGINIYELTSGGDPGKTANYIVKNLKVKQDGNFYSAVQVVSDYIKNLPNRLAEKIARREAWKSKKSGSSSSSSSSAPPVPPTPPPSPPKAPTPTPKPPVFEIPKSSTFSTPSYFGTASRTARTSQTPPASAFGSSSNPTGDLGGPPPYDSDDSSDSDSDDDGPPKKFFSPPKTKKEKSIIPTNKKMASSEEIQNEILTILRRFSLFDTLKARGLENKLVFLNTKRKMITVLGEGPIKYSVDDFEYISKEKFAESFFRFLIYSKGDYQINPNENLLEMISKGTTSGNLLTFNSKTDAIGKLFDENIKKSLNYKEPKVDTVKKLMKNLADQINLLTVEAANEDGNGDSAIRLAKLLTKYKEIKSMREVMQDAVEEANKVADDIFKDARFEKSEYVYQSPIKVEDISKVLKENYIYNARTLDIVTSAANEAASKALNIMVGIVDGTIRPDHCNGEFFDATSGRNPGRMYTKERDLVAPTKLQKNTFVDKPLGADENYFQYNSAVVQKQAKALGMSPGQIQQQKIQIDQFNTDRKALNDGLLAAQDNAASNGYTAEGLGRSGITADGTISADFPRASGVTLSSAP